MLPIPTAKPAARGLKPAPEVHFATFGLNLRALLLALAAVLALEAGPGWTYRVQALRGGAELRVEADYAGPDLADLTVDEGAEPFVAEVEVETPRGWTAVPRRRGYWHPPLPTRGPLRLRYRFLMAEAAAALRSLDSLGSTRAKDIHYGTPGHWLLRPEAAPDDLPVDLRVETEAGTAFVTGYPQDPQDPTAYRTTRSGLESGPYSAFGPFRILASDHRGIPVRLALPSGLAVPEADLETWVRTSLGAVAGYLGAFPAPRLTVMALRTRGPEVVFGAVTGTAGACVVVLVGEAADGAALGRDWVLVHECLHLALPTLPRNQRWFSEGLATYAEPLARARAGRLSEAEVWRGFLRSMAQGLPAPGDRGLDRTPTWGRTYWGGALFCLLADLEFRQRSGGRLGLEDALRGIYAASGGKAAAWDLGRTFRAGDRATGLTVLADLHARHGRRPEPVDLEALWKRLGVRLEGDGVAFDETAPWAPLRRALTTGPSAR